MSSRHLLVHTKTLEAWKKSVVPWIIVVEMSFPAPLSTYSPYNYWVCVFSKGRGAVVFWVSIWVFTNPIQDVLTSPKWESGPAWQNHKSLPPSFPLLLCYFNSLAKKGCHKNRLQKLCVYLIGACLKVWNGGLKLEDWLLKNLGGYQLIGSHFSSR